MRVNGRRKAKSGGRFFEAFVHVEDDIRQFKSGKEGTVHAWQFRLEQATRTALGAPTVRLDDSTTWRLSFHAQRLLLPSQHLYSNPTYYAELFYYGIWLRSSALRYYDTDTT